MRIIGGRFKRHSLLTPQGDEARPTTDRAREAIFNLVQHRVALGGATVLDLFAGTGALGLEALSRGAGAITFVDDQAPMVNLARQNASRLGVDLPCRFVQQDAITFLEIRMDVQTMDSYDLILADPPYRWPRLKELVDLAISRLSDGGIFVLEHDRNARFTSHDNLETERSYGRTGVSVFAADQSHA